MQIFTNVYLFIFCWSGCQKFVSWDKFMFQRHQILWKKQYSKNIQCLVFKVCLRKMWIWKTWSPFKKILCKYKKILVMLGSNDFPPIQNAKYFVCVSFWVSVPVFFEKNFFIHRNLKTKLFYLLDFKMILTFNPVYNQLRL